MSQEHKIYALHTCSIIKIGEVTRVLSWIATILQTATMLLGILKPKTTIPKMIQKSLISFVFYLCLF